MKPLFQRVRDILWSCLLCAFAMPLAQAQDAYPVKPIELEASFRPGGGTGKLLPQPIIVSNRAGAGGSIGLSYVANSAPDGYHMAMVFPELLTISLLGIHTVSHKDFAPIARFTSDPSSITVRADAPWQTLEEFIAYAKANPGKLSTSNAGIGTVPHLAAELLGKALDTSFNHVPYQGSAPAIMAILGEQVDFTTVAHGELREHVVSGKLRTLAVIGEERLPGLDAPTLREQGIDLVSDLWRGIVVPKNTPPAVLAVLRDVAAKVMQDPQFIAVLEKQNLTLAYLDADAFSAQLDAQSKAYQELFKTLDLQIQR